MKHTQIKTKNQKNLIKTFRDLGIDESTIRYTAKYNQEKQKNNLKTVIAATPTYLITTQLTQPDWLTLILGAAIYLLTYVIIAPLIGAIDQTDTRNLKEMTKTLGPLTPILAAPLNLIEHLITKFQNN